MNPASLPARLLKSLLVSLSKSRFFTVSLIIHSAIVVLLGGTVLFKAAVEESEFFGLAGDGTQGGAFLQDTPPMPVQPVTPATPTTQTPTPAVTAAPSTTIQSITTTAPSATNFHLPTFITTAPAPKPAAAAAAAPAPTAAGQMTAAAGQNIRQFTQGWSGGSGAGQGSGRPLKTRKFQFKAYLAQYSKGDWSSTVVLSRQAGKQTIVKGSLPNLLYVMKKWTGDRIEASSDPVPLKLDSGEIFTAKPPFIFFTGRRDFELTETEVGNLRKYVMSGGAIWGDSTLPGKRSRFDIAFRREMKRVLPDRNKDWEPLPAGHPLFSGDQRQVYFPEIREVPTGLNYYREPIEVLKIYDQIAVLYSANNYADQWQIGIDENGAYDMRRDKTGNDYIAITQEIWNKRDFYFRNLEEPALIESYKFGINVVTHLLIRWEDPISRVPKM